MIGIPSPLTGPGRTGFSFLLISFFLLAYIISPAIGQQVLTDDEIAEIEAQIIDLAGEGRFAEAQELTGRLLASLRDEDGKCTDYECYEWLETSGILYVYDNEYESALEVYSELAEAAKEIFGTGSLEETLAIDMLGDLNYDLGNYREAEAAYLKVKDRYQNDPGVYSDEYLVVLFDLYTVYEAMEEIPSAAEMGARRIELMKEIYGVDLDLAIETQNLAVLLHIHGYHNEAITFYELARGYFEDADAADDENYAVLLSNLIHIYNDTGNFDGKKQTFSMLIDFYRRDGDLESLYDVMPVYVQMLREAGIFDEGEVVLQEMLELMRRQAPGSEEHLMAKSYLGMHYMEWGFLNRSYDLFSSVWDALSGQEETGILYVTAATNMGSIHMRMGSYPEAETYLDRALQLSGDSGLTDDAIYVIILNNLSIVYRETARYQESIELLNTAVEKMTELYGDQYPEIATMYGNMASAYMALADYAEAERLYLKALDMYEAIAGTDFPHHITMTINLARLYIETGDYATSEKLFKDALERRAVVYGRQSYDFAEALTALSSLYLQVGRNLESIELLEEALEITEPNQPIYPTIFGNMGTAYKNLTDYTRAKTYYTRSAEAYKTIYGENHPYYFTSVDMLGLMYLDTGDFIEAERLIREAGSMRLEFLGESHPDFIRSINNLGFVYRELGDHYRALSLFNEAADYFSANFSDEHPLYADITGNIGMTLFDLGMYDEAEPIFKETLRIRGSVYGERHTHYIGTLNNIGLLYRMTDRADEGIVYLRQADSLYTAIYPAGRNYHPAVLNNLALSYMIEGNNPAALDAMQRSVAMQEDVLGEDHPQLSLYLVNLAQAYFMSDLPGEAMSVLRRASEMDLKFLDSVSLFLTEFQQEQYLMQYQAKFRYYNSRAVQFVDDDPQLAAWSLELNYGLKGLMLTNARQMAAAIRESGDPELIAVFDQWRELKQVIAGQYTLPADERRTDLSDLEIFAENLEKDMAMESGLFNESRIQTRVSTIADQLEVHQAAIEFGHIPAIDYETDQPTGIYAAWVVRSGMEIPVLIELFREEKLAELMQAMQRSSDRQTVDGLYRTITGTGPARIDYDGPGLYELIWEELEPYLHGVDEVFYAPDGQLHRLSFAAIRDADGNLLSDRYRLNRVTSTRLLALKDASPAFSSSPDVLLFGGIDYESSADTTTGETDDVIPVMLPESAVRGSDWTYLPGTLREAEILNNLLADAGAAPVKLTGTEATEDKLYKFQGDQAPEILHIATHGFFFPDPDPAIVTNLADGRAFRLAENPMLRSGLAFAGANAAWRGDEVPVGRGDGILTALEAARLDLTNTRLLVLSACETGLGDIKGSEGVFGLQRAFMLAGVSKLIISLWQVPDNETVELMEYFYTSLLGGNTVRDAFHEAREKMKKKYDPYYWAAFELIE